MNPRLSNRLLFAIAGGLMFVIAGYLYWDEHRAAPSGPPPQVANLRHTSVIERRPGRRPPKAIPASKARLGGQIEVLGVTAAGRHRAYELGIFATPDTRLINDLIGDIPVSVAYCMKLKRHRAFTSDERGSPLEAWVINSGREDHLVCRIGEIAYSVDTGDLPPPLKELPVTRTTWKEWKQAHPDTDVVWALRPPQNRP